MNQNLNNKRDQPDLSKVCGETGEFWIRGIVFAKISEAREINQHLVLSIEFGGMRADNGER